MCAIAIVPTVYGIETDMHLIAFDIRFYTIAIVPTVYGIETNSRRSP